MRNMYRAGAVLAVMLVIAACGNIATPRYEADQIIAEAEAEAAHTQQEIVETATEEPTVAPTSTPEPTEVPTEAPTATPLPPTATPVPTEVPTEAPAESESESAEAAIIAAVAEADAAAGETTFLATGCTGCHMTTDMQLVGPGLEGLFTRAGEHTAHRPADQSAYEYVFTSIRDSQAFIVEGFTPGLMPQYTEAQLSDQDIYNIMAYLEQFSN